MLTVSVVIPVKNGQDTIKKCLDGIFSQTVSVSEVIVIDSGSTDGTLEILKSYNKVRILQVLPQDFNHGDTRNLGVQHASTDTVLLTVQDAWAVDEYWIERLLKPLNNKDVVAVCGQQIVPHEKDKNPIQWFRSYSQPQIITYSFTPASYEALSSEEKRQICGWDDVTALYKREVLLKMPFRKTLFAEDAYWANDALQAGYTIAYNHAARVFHYHHEDLKAAFKRSIAEMYSMYVIFKIMPNSQPAMFHFLLHAIKCLYKAEGITMSEKYKWLKYNLQLRAAYGMALNVFNATMKNGESSLEDLFIKVYKNQLLPSAN